jgi:hypothetical protein
MTEVIMPEMIDQLAGWLQELENKHPAEWAMLPDIGLYMDQVQTYIDRQLALYHRDDNDRLLTPAMINNYIKDNLIPRADMKKYTQVHLGLLIMIGTLKQVLSIPNLNQLLSAYRDSTDVSGLYGRFLEVQRDSLKENASQVLAEAQALSAARRMNTAEIADAADEAAGETVAEDADDGTTAALRHLALQLSIEARTRILIAEKIIAMLAADKAAPKPAPRPEEPARKAAPRKAQPKA